MKRQCIWVLRKKEVFIVYVMNTMKKFNVLCWNVRGLSNPEKSDVVRNQIKDSRCDVICIQETKWNGDELTYVSRVLPTFFERNCVILSAR